MLMAVSVRRRLEPSMATTVGNWHSSEMESSVLFSYASLRFKLLNSHWKK